MTQADITAVSAGGQFATALGAQHRLQCRRIAPDGNPNDRTADHDLDHW